MKKFSREWWQSLPPEKTGKLYTYHCPECGGWHLTRRRNPGMAVTLEEFKGSD